jgi:hypothetical protein
VGNSGSRIRIIYFESSFFLSLLLFCFTSHPLPNKQTNKQRTNTKMKQLHKQGDPDAGASAASPFQLIWTRVSKAVFVIIAVYAAAVLGTEMGVFG